MKNIKEFDSLIAGRSMMARLAASVAGLGLLLSSAAMAQTIGTIDTEIQTIDFETVPGGAPTDNLAVDTQFQATTGISFSLEGGASPLLAQVGGVRTAFAGPPSNSTNDTVVAESAAAVGDFFLTDDGMVGTNAPDLIISFSDPVSSISGVVIDVDGMENFLFQALNSEGTVVGTDSVAFSDSDTDDGVLTPWAVDVGTNSISSLKIISQGGLLFGLAFDNLVTVEQILGVVFNADDLVNTNFDPTVTFVSLENESAFGVSSPAPDLGFDFSEAVNQRFVRDPNEPEWMHERRINDFLSAAFHGDLRDEGATRELISNLTLDQLAARTAYGTLEEQARGILDRDSHFRPDLQFVQPPPPAPVAEADLSPATASIRTPSYHQDAEGRWRIDPAPMPSADIIFQNQTPPSTEQFNYQNIADLINASLNPDFRDPAAQPEEPSVSELSEAEAQELSAAFARDLEQYQQDSIQRDINEALGIQDQDDMNNGIESVIPELAGIVVL